MDIALGVVLPGDVRMVKHDELVGVPLPRREEIQRRRSWQSLRQPAAAEPVAHAVDGVIDVRVVGDEDVFQRPVPQFPGEDGRDQVARPQAEGDG